MAETRKTSSRKTTAAADTAAPKASKSKSTKAETPKPVKPSRGRSTAKTSGDAKPAPKKTAKPAPPKKETVTKTKAAPNTAQKPASKSVSKKSAGSRTGKGSETASTKAAKPSKSVKAEKLRETTFKLNQEVVYPLQGVGQIISIEEKDFRNQKLLYYIIYLEVSDMTVMVPVDKAEELGIRAIVNPSESQKALKLITEDFEPVTADWKLRYQMNLDLLKSGSVMDIATVVRTLYHRSKVKELPILERKLFDSALKLLVDEISFSLEKTKEDVEQLVFSKLEND